MYIGADYYPEHWDRKRWKTDARLMREAGFNVTRLAEFAWVNMEPAEGEFVFDWLEDALGVLAGHDIDALLCTPTAVMPAWVAHNYPECLAAGKDGRRVQWGVRKHNCYTSPAYRGLSARITRAMAERFAKTPNVIGWQTDNEFGAPRCACEHCERAFREWLRGKYGSTDALNTAWGAHFWGHAVKSWDEVVLPLSPHSHNPSACLDWRRFHSWLIVRFQREQVEILREVCPQHFVTHNLMGFDRAINYFDLSEDLDFVAYDNYPLWDEDPKVRSKASIMADLMRGVKKKNFWIMEQTAGPCGWGAFGRNPRPGEIRSIAYQQLAHGADAQVWFRWRTCTAGREQYWHGLLGHDGKPLRRYREAAQTAAEYHSLWKDLKDTTVAAEAAVVYDYDSIWALEAQPGFPGCDFQKALRRYTDALFRAGVNVDFVKPGDDLSRYKLVLAPALHVMPDERADWLDAFVRRGGVLLTDCRAAVKDMNNQCWPRTLPGSLSKTLGLRIEEYEALGAGMEYRIEGSTEFHADFTAVEYVDWLTPESAKPMATYEQWHLEGFAALTRNALGSGAAWYAGAVVREPEFYDRLIERLLADAGIKPFVSPLPEGVEASVRAGKGRRILFLINHLEEEKSVEVPAGGYDLLAKKRAPKIVTLARHEVAVIRYKE